MMLYHGTCSIHLQKIKEEGLLKPYWTDVERIARSFARNSCIVAGRGKLIGKPIVIACDEKIIRKSKPQIDMMVYQFESGSPSTMPKSSEWRRSLREVHSIRSGKTVDIKRCEIK